MSPVLRSMEARMSCSCPYLERPAFWIACSIASSTSSRSMPFSRATASATCRSSRRGTTMLASMLLRSFHIAGPFGLGGAQLVGQHQFGPADQIHRQHVSPLRLGDHHRFSLDAEDAAAEAALAFQRLGQLDLRLMACEAGEIGSPGERAIDAG